jgi:hypothetical protein
LEKKRGEVFTDGGDCARRVKEGVYWRDEFVREGVGVVVVV